MAFLFVIMRQLGYVGFAMSIAWSFLLGISIPKLYASVSIYY